MKKNAIVTLYGEFNYGNRLQNYAVSKCLSDWKEEAVTIVKRKPISQKVKVKIAIKSALAKALPGFTKKRYPILMREENFKKFTKKHIPTKFYKGNIETQKEKYHRFIVGSDQVWNPCFGGFENLYDEMFLIGIPKEKKSCFAPSFGVSEIPGEWKERFQEGLSSFPHLCAREDAGGKIISDLVGKDALLMIDPTLMLDAKDWEEVACPVEGLPEKYVLDYFLGETPNTENYHRLLCDEYANQRIRLLNREDPDIYVSGPGEFITLIAGSSLVCTDSFHACVFSILFGKPFAIFKREGKEKDMFSRLYTLLELFDIDTEKLLSGDVIFVAPEKRDEVLNKKREEVTLFFNK